MVEVKVLCPCGTKYKFDVEPVQGRMPAPVRCPACSADGTALANDYLQCLGVPTATAAPALVANGPTATATRPAPPAPPSTTAAKPSLRLSGAASPSGEPAATEGAPTAPSQVGRSAHGPQPLLNRTIFFIRERVGL